MESINFKVLLAETETMLEKRPIKSQKYYLTFARKCWESEVFRANGYSFSTDQLDDAEKSQEKLIGNRNGFDCYLSETI